MTDTAKHSEAEAPGAVHVTIDGRGVDAAPGELIIDAAERAGTFIPRFCYHPRMAPVGMCRMCLVEVSGPRGFSLQPACFLRVVEGQEIRTDSPKARKAQEGVLELLLVNHPLDCPVCDKGGECPLQDQSLSHGPGESRFIEEKRHWAKPIEIGPLTYLDRERCIQCARCTRFAAEIAGDAQIDFSERGDRIEVAPFPTQPFDSYFSGNTVQICPVGALTAVPYRFKSRPWDLEQVESTCTTCAVGCRIVAQSSAGALVRYLGVDSDPVNQSWLCDKGRYGFEAVDAPRLREPLLRREGVLEPARWARALADVAAGAREALAKGGPEAIGVLGGARFANEDAYAWARLSKSVFGTDSVDAQLGDGLPAELVLGLPQATIDDVAAASALLVVAGDLREELPVLFLRLRAAVVTSKVPLVECSSVPTALSSAATARLAAPPGHLSVVLGALVSPGAPTSPVADAASFSMARAVLGLDGAAASPTGAGVVVVLGRANLAESDGDVAAAARLLAAALPGARFLPALRRANVRGALDLGLAPGILPGRVGLPTPSPALLEVWGSVPASRGRDCRAILEAGAAGELSMLVLLGADPLGDFPDTDLARRCLETVPFVVALGTHADASNELADVVLPVVGDAERAGTTTNLEGRVTRLAPKVVPPGVARPPWMVATELAGLLGADFGYENVESLWSEIERVAPAHRGLGVAALGSPALRDGVVVPLAAARVALGARPRPDEQPRPLDPIATPGIASVEEQGAPLRTGAAEPQGGSAEEPEGSDGAPRQLLSMTDSLGASAVPAPTASGSLRLVVRRRLYDRGTLVLASPHLAPLAIGTVVALNPIDAASFGDGPVRVVGPKGSLVAPIVADAAVPPGLVVLDANRAGDGGSAFALLDAALDVHDVRLEKP